MAETGIHADAAANILVVDDDEYLNRYISLLLRLENFNVRSAFTGAEALKDLQDDEQPDLVLLDLLLPDLNGVDIYREARQLGYRGPIIFCSSYGAAAAKLQMGAAGAIDKPFHPEALVEIIRSQLEAA